MITRQLPDGWLVFLRDDQETEVMRVKLPDGGCTREEIEAFCEHIRKLAREQQHGPS